ncbi:MAG: hypothetical protein COY80_05400 [Candidatus Pacebacteria bacterium CG_4_10_14_0_8_um_filter_42_14]|nr:MAG: hypothetical protein COY80_05400 [Candidatus Pacebacteria bacterium CG_4_10_14_0_8_um_filter_42_14]
MTDSNLSFNAVSTFAGQNFLLILLAVFLLGGGFFTGSIWTENKLLKSGATGSVQGATQAAAQPPSAPAQPTTGTVSTDDDPILGDKNAPVTIVEFSDYECPFCKRHFDETLPKLISDYIDTGKVKLVFRDLPLPFHEPMATKEAVAANCAREQGGDEKYFEFHDEIFTRTISNGNGLDDAKIQTIASDLGLDTASFTTCLSDKAMEDEVKKDLADGGKAGASGTPTFIIGKSTSDGEISGDLVVGAQPYSVFKAVIDPLLK